MANKGKELNTAINQRRAERGANGKWRELGFRCRRGRCMGGQASPV